MVENKLKNMIENGELDNLIYAEKEKVCKLKTSEEVLELLKKYNYSESREVFETELLNLLKDAINDEELAEVSGGRVNKRSLAKVVGSMALATAMCYPSYGKTTSEKPIAPVPGVTQVAKKTSSKSGVKLLSGAIFTGLAGIALYTAVDAFSLYPSYRLQQLNNTDYDNITTYIGGLLASDAQKLQAKEHLKGYTVGQLKGWALQMVQEWCGTLTFDDPQGELMELRGTKANVRKLCLVHACLLFITEEMTTLSDETELVKISKPDEFSYTSQGRYFYRFASSINVEINQSLSPSRNLRTALLLDTRQLVYGARQWALFRDLYDEISKIATVQDLGVRMNLDCLDW